MGDKLELESAVIISNHQSLGDHILMAFLARYVNNQEFKKSNAEGSNNTSYFLTLPRINFFTWFSIWQIPNLNTWFNMFKSDENWEIESHLTKSLPHDQLHSKFIEWIVLFPEVNVFSERDLLLQNHSAKKYFLPPFTNVLYPRFSALANIIRGLASNNINKFTRLYDITILYKKQPSLLEFFISGNQIDVQVYIKKRLISKIPINRYKLEKYLEYTWVEKDKLISRMRTLPEISDVNGYTAFLEKLRTPKTLKSSKSKIENTPQPPNSKLEIPLQPILEVIKPEPLQVSDSDKPLELQVEKVDVEQTVQTVNTKPVQPHKFRFEKYFRSQPVIDSKIIEQVPNPVIETDGEKAASDLVVDKIEKDVIETDKAPTPIRSRSPIKRAYEKLSKIAPIDSQSKLNQIVR